MQDFHYLQNTLTLARKKHFCLELTRFVKRFIVIFNVPKITRGRFTNISASTLDLFAFILILYKTFSDMFLLVDKYIYV